LFFAPAGQNICRKLIKRKMRVSKNAHNQVGLKIIIAPYPKACLRQAGVF